MKYTVVWRPSAESKLAEIWLNATDKQAVTDSADTIEALLATSPLDVGESRWKEGTRILSVMPLSVYYDVHVPDRRVEVWAIWFAS